MNNWIIYMLVTGDYPGFSVAGIEEDAPIVSVLYHLHTFIFGWVTTIGWQSY